MWRFVLLFTDSMELYYTPGKKAEFFGYMNLYLVCHFGHRSSIHANMTDAEVALAKADGDAENGYVIQVSMQSIAVHLVTHAFVFIEL